MNTHLIPLSLATLLLSSTSFAADLPTRYLVRFDAAHRVGAARMIESNGFKIHKYFPEIDVYVADSLERMTPERARHLLKTPGLLYAEPEAVWHAISQDTITSVPNDPLYAEQAEVKRMDVETAWNTTTGSAQILVAVSDTGASFDHPDLQNQLSADGYNFVAGNNQPIDDNGHGTHVSGILGAEGGNGVGVTGVNWRTKILPVKFLDANGSGVTTNGIQTLLYAANHGARVVNCSWSGSVNSSALKDAIDYAYSHGTLVVAAAGNDSANTDTKPVYPADFRVPGVIAVASSYVAGGLSGFSNFGVRTVFIAAPGENVLSTLRGGQYGRLSGTSMAAPMATGVAALMLSVAPQLSTLDLRNALINAVEERSTYAGKIASAGDLSARLAVQQLSGGFQVWPARMTLGTGEEHTFTAYHPSGKVTWTSSNTGIASVDSSGKLKGLKTGEVTLTARDAGGHQATTQWVRVVQGPIRRRRRGL